MYFVAKALLCTKAFRTSTKGISMFELAITLLGFGLTTLVCLMFFGRVQAREEEHEEPYFWGTTLKDRGKGKP
ncbi:MAG: hypothetical protein COV91_06455 [Candidatus Taylorbacteria bacterium CG11_big_fil_rev_8_21_14_0_20_46_11]|uniref:Uncharacterized protein n=1 Tax=Candidatus Taylorbacteria bacterium CG11_big_fil_rev_8_21_14_0_20_46_11 TaxID=1975025 RepID=A0A2H0K9T7_9BACT|nr:MAG: hypothetical protein COV91_06455 [Candidatus Taylorbacteria bacterium CG11_big_fil_rev_8_21_14_0_20_46_11]